jgi:importin-9
MEDPIFLSLLNDILLSIASSKTLGVYKATVKQALPRPTASIRNYNANQSWAVLSALELTGSLVRGAPETGLGEGFFAAIAPMVFKCLRVAKDRNVLQVPIFLQLASPWSFPSLNHSS